MTVKDIAARYGFYDARMITSDPKWYRRICPFNEVVFNAEIMLLPRGEGETWINSCDIDLTREEKKLKDLSREIEGNVFVYTSDRTLIAHYFRGRRRFLHRIAYRNFIQRLFMRLRDLFAGVA